MTPFEALRVATIAHLKADAAVADIVAAKIYDEAPRDNRGHPSDAQAPFIYFGAIGWRRVELGCNRGYDTALRLYAVSTKFGRGQVWRLHEAMIAALDGAELTLQGGHVMTPYTTSAGGDVIGPLSPKECFLDLRTQLSDATP